MINRAVAQPPAHVERPFGTTSNSRANTKTHEAKQPSDVQKQCNKHKQTQADEANTSRNREKHKQNEWEAQAGTRRNTSRNNEKHKEKTQAETRRNPSRNKDKHKPKQEETPAKIEGSTSRNRGTH